LRKLVFSLQISEESPAMSNSRQYEFGQYLLDPDGHVLFRNGERMVLTPKAVDLLVALVEEEGKPLGKEELLQRVWPDTIVEEGSLTSHISLLRKALGEGPDGKQFIETIPKRGYRFTASVREICAPQTRLSYRIMLAVLPFENLTGRESHEYFSDGLTEEMISQLGRLNPERLGVIARTSAMLYKRTKKSIQQIGRELSVNYILEGSVRRAAKRARITAQLIQVSDQTHVWAESYERGMGDLLALQSEVARAIANEIRIKLTREEQARRTEAQPVDPEAHVAYLKGCYLWSQRTKETLRKSVSYFQKAIQINPRYAAAHAGLADAYLSLHDDGQLDPHQAIPQAKESAAKALAIDEAIAEAHTSLAHAFFHEFDWHAAQRHFQRAIALNPNYFAAHFYYANYLVANGQFDEALAEARRAQSLDPVSLVAGSNTAGVLYHAGEFDRSIEQSLKILDMDPRAARPYEDLGRSYEQKGMYQPAIRAFRRAVTLSQRGPGYLASLAYAYALTGDRKETSRLFQELEQAARKKPVSPYAFALVRLGLGDMDGAFTWLEKAYEERSSASAFLKVNPRLSPLRSDSRFQALVRRMNFPQ
jgi:TolB-like protein/Flp pilus assembly protein TadD